MAEYVVTEVVRRYYRIEARGPLEALRRYREEAHERAGVGDDLASCTVEGPGLEGQLETWTADELDDEEGAGDITAGARPA